MAILRAEDRYLTGSAEIIQAGLPEGHHMVCLMYAAFVIFNPSADMG
jgi:hypothetical protein